jgi:hypothetical protein
VPTPTCSHIGARTRARAVALGPDDLRGVGPISALASAVAVVALLGGPATATAAPAGSGGRGADGGTAAGAPGAMVGAAAVGDPRDGRGADGGKLDTIGVAPFGPATLPFDLRARLEESATAGLVATGARVVTRASVARAEAGAGLASCGGDSGCLARLSSVTGARLWLRGLFSTDGSTYHIHLDLFDPSAVAAAGAGAVVAARDDNCEICTEAEVAEMTNVAASALRASWRRSAGLPAAPTVARARPPDGLAQPGGGEGRATRISVTSSPGPSPGLASSTRPLWGQVLPVALLVAGAAAGGAGIYLAHENNRDTDFVPSTNGDLVPRSRYDTGRWAVASFGAAAVLVGAAVTLFVLSGPGTASASASTSASTSASDQSWARPARDDRALVRLGLAGTGLDLSGAF